MNFEGIILFLGYVAFFLWIGKEHGRGIAEGLKGSNNKWDIEEVVMISGLLMLIIAFGANLFLNYEVNLYIYGSIELIIFIALGSKKFQDKK